MKGFALVLVLGVGTAAGSTAFQVPFDRYIATVKQHRPAIEVIQFANECGIAVAGNQPIYGLGGANWVISHNLPKDVYDAESDFLTTVEAWRQDGRIQIVNLWTTDAEQEQNTLYCFDQTGVVRFVESTSYALLYEGKGQWSLLWAYVQRIVFTDGKITHQTGKFIDQHGLTIPKSKLDKDDVKSFDFVPRYLKLSDFGFPEKMLH